MPPRRGIREATPDSPRAKGEREDKRVEEVVKGGLEPKDEGSP